MTQEPEEIWRPVYMEGFEHLYHVSNLGRIKSLARQVRQVSFRGTPYYAYRAEKILSMRQSKKSPLLLVTLSKTVDDKRISKSLYVHKAVAAAFVDNPRGFTKVTHRDMSKPHLNIPENLKWADDSFLSYRNMELHPHLRNKLRDINIASGYYEKLKIRGTRTKNDESN